MANWLHVDRVPAMCYGAPALAIRPLPHEHTMHMQPQLSLDALSAATIRGLAIDGIQAANSGHPGMPLGMADVAHVLWSRFLKFDPTAPEWPDRDRFVLSAGHGSMLQYALLHLYGYPLTIDDLKQFRQLGSRTPGHPERGHTAGIETTTGPLGQGLANGVGMALAEARLREAHGTACCDHRTYVIAGDGCMMEGITAEAASLAGHLGLGRLVVLYDDNHISIDGPTEITFTEDVAARFVAYGWQVSRVDGHDMEQIDAALREAVSDESRPSLIVCRTTIGQGSPKMAGTSKVHGSPLGADEVAATKLAIGLDPKATFAVAPAVYDHLRAANAKRTAARQAWESRTCGPEAAAFRARMAPQAADIAKTVAWPSQAVGAQLSTRKGGEQVLQALAKALPNLIGGSADLGHSAFTDIAGGGSVQKGAYVGRNIHFGVREHAMAAICNGLAAHGGHLPYCSTFLVFHDYMRPSVRLAALMGLQVVFVYSHDSFFVGEDGPTHQPIETLQALRLIPDLVLLRPCDLAETAAAWQVAIERTQGPTTLSLTRQNLPEIERPEGFDVTAAVAKGAYVLREASHPLRLVLLATGSEVALALGARDQLEASGIGVRVVSMPSCELFDAQPAAYRASVLVAGVATLSIEAGARRGWERYVGPHGDSIGLDTFGASGPDKVLAEHFGFTVPHVVARARALIGA